MTNTSRWNTTDTIPLSIEITIATHAVMHIRDPYSNTYQRLIEIHTALITRKSTIPCALDKGENRLHKKQGEGTIATQDT